MDNARKLLKNAVVDAFEPKKDDLSQILKDYKQSLLELKESLTNLKEAICTYQTGK